MKFVKFGHEKRPYCITVKSEVSKKKVTEGKRENILLQALNMPLLNK